MLRLIFRAIVAPFKGVARQLLRSELNELRRSVAELNQRIDTHQDGSVTRFCHHTEKFSELKEDLEDMVRNQAFKTSASVNHLNRRCSRLESSFDEVTVKSS